MREYLWKEKAEMIKEKDTLQGKLKELKQRLKQVCTYPSWYSMCMHTQFKQPEDIACYCTLVVIY